MYVAIDEASKHVQTKHFRLLVGVFDAEHKELLGTACSQPIRVLANNDCPTGAAFIQLNVPIKYGHYCTLSSHMHNSCLKRDMLAEQLSNWPKGGLKFKPDPIKTWFLRCSVGLSWYASTVS